MGTLNYIHLDNAKAEKINAELQILLASYQLYYTNLRGFHWNIKGEAFFTLHEKFEELYDDAATKIDEIAERILTLGGSPNNSFADYFKQSTIEDVSGVADGGKCVDIVLENLGKLIAKQKEILSLAGDAQDDSTASMMSDNIKEQEKLVWMLVAYKA